MSERDLLEQFMPSDETAKTVARQLVIEGNRPEDIPMAWVSCIIAATYKSIAIDRVTANEALSKLNLSVTKGDNKKTYYHLNKKGERKEIDADDLIVVKGAFVCGTSVPYESISYEPKQTQPCEGCGASVHCGIEVRDPAAKHGALALYCNYCITNNADARVSQYGGNDICLNCDRNTCPNNPARLSWEQGGYF